MKTLPEVKKAWKDFEPPKCKKCGSQNVIWNSSIGWSETSGGWGSVDLMCKECNNSLTLYE